MQLILLRAGRPPARARGASVGGKPRRGAPARAASADRAAQARAGGPLMSQNGPITALLLDRKEASVSLSVRMSARRRGARRANVRANACKFR